jgi:two-component system, chemotaxis family, protein-glutamate methylesterase/glutaminase
MQTRPINTLIVEDSPVVQMVLTQILKSDPAIYVLGAAANGEAAVELHARLRADVILMDIHLPKMNGFEATRRIMETQPVPIVICSATSNPSDVAATFQALEAGAVAFVNKPLGLDQPAFAEAARKLVQTIKLMAEVKVVRRWARPRHAATPPTPSSTPAGDHPGHPLGVVAIGASTGGPPALETILQQLPNDFPSPILVVQHIAAGFLPGLAEWLAQTTRFPVHIAAPGELPLPGHVYLAPDGFHMGLGSDRRILLRQEEPEEGLRPAVSWLFRSVARVWGRAAVGILLTGMGRDGATGLRTMRDRGAVTIAQDPNTAIVPGMPGEAIRLEAASYVLAPQAIADLLCRLTLSKPDHQPHPAFPGRLRVAAEDPIGNPALDSNSLPPQNRKEPHEPGNDSRV